MYHMSEQSSASLRDIDQVQDLLDRLRLDRDARSKGAVVVEGENDAVILDNVTQTDLRFFPVAGRVNVLRVADRLAETYLRGVICVADLDFDDECDGRTSQWFLIFTDDADPEAMLYWSPALDRVLREWGSNSKYNAYGGVDAVREQVDKIVSALALLRSWNAAVNAGLPFDTMDLSASINKQTLALNTTSLVDRLKQPGRVEATEIREALQETAEPTCPYTGRLRARGRDRLAVVGVALRSAIGSLSKQQVVGGLVERSLRLTSRPSDFATTPFMERLEAALARARTA
jgi:hypothetical protein